MAKPAQDEADDQRAAEGEQEDDDGAEYPAGRPATEHRSGPGTVCRRSTAAEARPTAAPAVAPLGNNGSSTARCSPVRSLRPMNRDHSHPKIHFRPRP